MIFGSVSTVFLLLYTGCLCHPVHISQDVPKNITMVPLAKEPGYDKSPVVEKKGTIRISGPWHSDSALDRNIDLGEDSYVKKIISSNEGINFNKDMAEAGEMFDVNGIEDFYDKNAVVTYEVNGHEIPVHLKQKYTPQTKVMFPEYSRDSPATGAAIGKSNPPSPPTAESDSKKCRKPFSCLEGTPTKLISSKTALRSGTRRGVQQSAPHSHHQPSIHSHSYDRILGNEDNVGELKDRDLDNGREEVNRMKTADVRKSNEEELEAYKHEVDDPVFASHKHESRNLPHRESEVDKEGEKFIPETIQKFKDAGKPFIMNTDSIDYKPKGDEEGDDEKEIENKMPSPITPKATNDITSGIISKFSSKIHTGKSRAEQYHENVEDTNNFEKEKKLEDERMHVSDLNIKQAQMKKNEENEDSDTKSSEYGREDTQRRGRHHKYAFENDDSSRRNAEEDYFVIHARNKGNDHPNRDEGREVEYEKSNRNEDRESSNHPSDEENKARDEESFTKMKPKEESEEKEERDMRSHQAVAAGDGDYPTHTQSSKEVHKSRDNEDSQGSKESKNHHMNEYEEEQRDSAHESHDSVADSSHKNEGVTNQNRNDDRDLSHENQNQEPLKEDRNMSMERKIQNLDTSNEYEDYPHHQKVNGDDVEKAKIKHRDPGFSYQREKNDEISDDSSKASSLSHKNEAEKSKDSENHFKDSDTDIMDKHKVQNEIENHKNEAEKSKDSDNHFKDSDTDIMEKHKVQNEIENYKNEAEKSKDSENHFKDSDTDIMEKHKVQNEIENYKEKEEDSKEKTINIKETINNQKQSKSDVKEEQNEKTYVGAISKEYPRKDTAHETEGSVTKNKEQDKSVDYEKEKYISKESKSSDMEPISSKNEGKDTKESSSKEIPDGHMVSKMPESKDEYITTKHIKESKSSDMEPISSKNDGKDTKESSSKESHMVSKMPESKDEYITTKQTDSSKKEDNHISDKPLATPDKGEKDVKDENYAKNSGREKAMRLLEELNGDKETTAEKKPDTITQEGEVTYKAIFHQDDHKENKDNHGEEHHDDHHDDYSNLFQKQEARSPDDYHHSSNDSQQHSESEHHDSQEAQNHQDSNHQDHRIEKQADEDSRISSKANHEDKKDVDGEEHKSLFGEGASRIESRKDGMISSRQEIGKEKERSFTPKTFPSEGTTEYPDYNEVRDAAVFETNLFRKNYHGNQLTWSEKLSDRAQQVADKIGKSYISDNGKPLDDFRRPGQNVALVKPNAANVGKDAVDLWSKESKDYDFKSPLVTKKNSDFVQLTWKNEKEFGMGVSKSIAGNGWVVVGMYDTPFADRYQELTSNVLPVKAVEDPYGDISG